MPPALPALHTVDQHFSVLGPPSSGKTSFLAALNIALTEYGTDWNLIGTTPAAEKLLIELTDTLSEERIFPPGTTAFQQLKWLLTGKHQYQVQGTFRKQWTTIPVAVSLDLTDVEGETFNPNSMATNTRAEVIEKIATSAGIIYFFDPIREFEVGDAYRHTDGVLRQLGRWMNENGGGFTGKLPHHLAVCITKFDDDRVFRSSEQLNLVSYGLDEKFDCPRVHPDDGEEFFRELCTLSRGGNGEKLPNLLGQFFERDHIRYFVTSAIGFYVDPVARKFDRSDPLNLLEGGPGTPPRIRATPRPINVVEPILWLNERMLSGQGPLQPSAVGSSGPRPGRPRFGASGPGSSGPGLPGRGSRNGRQSW